MKNYKGMSNHSSVNEALIELITLNLKERPNVNSVSVIRNTVFNNTILDKLKALPCNQVPRNERVYRSNIAKAYSILKRHFSYNKTCFCSRNPNCDTLYHAIDEFKRDLNTWFYNYFDYK